MTSMMVLVCGLCRPSVRLFPLYLLNQQTLNQKCKKERFRFHKLRLLLSFFFKAVLATRRQMAMHVRAVTHQPSTEQIIGWSDLYSIKGSFSSQQINNCGGGSPALTAVLQWLQSASGRGGSGQSVTSSVTSFSSPTMSCTISGIGRTTSAFSPFPGYHSRTGCWQNCVLRFFKNPESVKVQKWVFTFFSFHMFFSGNCEFKLFLKVTLTKSAIFSRYVYNAAAGFLTMHHRQATPKSVLQNIKFKNL